MQEHGFSLKRNIRVVNLDPAAEKFYYECNIDVRDLITVSDVMEKKKYGPNGALVYCMEYLLKNIAWLDTKLKECGEDNYFIFDCPGQLELYSHYSVMKDIISYLKNSGINVCCIFCLDSTFLSEKSKFISGSVLSLASMVQLELPHINVITKCDLIQDKKILEQFLEIDPQTFIEDDKEGYHGKKHAELSKALLSMVILILLLYRSKTFH